MSNEELRKRFIVGADAIREKLEPLISKALTHCLLAESGTVFISTRLLSTREKVALVLAARSLGSYLSEEMEAEVTVKDIAASTGLPENQIRARANELVRERFASSPHRGIYVANAHRIETFLDSLPQPV